MKTAVRTTLALAALLVAFSASAQPYLFAGAGTDSSVSIGAGYQATRHLGAELSYLTWKEDSTRAKGFGAYAVGTLPLTGAIALIGRVGPQYVSVGDMPSASLTVSNAVTGTPTAGPESEWVLGAGAGARYAFNANLSARLMLEHTEGKNRIPGADLFTLQVGYSF